MKRAFKYVLTAVVACFVVAASHSRGVCSTKAQQIEFLLSQVRNSSGPLSGGTVTFYGAGTTTKKTVWLDRDKTTPAANPYTLDANGTAQIYAEGLYRVVVKNAQGGIVYDRDNLAFLAFSATETANSQTVGGYFPSVDPVGSTVAVRDGNGALKGNILGNAVTLGNYSSSQSALPNRVAVRNGTGKLAGDILGNAATATLATLATDATNAGNADTVDTFHAVQGAGANQIPVLGSVGELLLNGDLIQGNSTVWRTTQSKYLAQNCQLVGGVWKYLAGGTASLYQIDYLGGLVFYTAPSGSAGATITWNSNTVWHSGNDGAGSGQDADLLDGQQGAYYQAAGAQNTAAPYARYESGLRIIRGSVAANGTVTAGAGFTVGVTGSTYTITFTNAFSSTPSVTATAFPASGHNGETNISSKSTSQVVIYTGAAAQDISSAMAFDFIAIGPN